MNNKFEVTFIRESGVHHFRNPDPDYDTNCIQEHLAEALTKELVATYPVTVEKMELDSLTRSVPVDVHKLTLFIFSEEEMEAHNALVRNEVHYAYATAKVFNNMDERVKH